jgi:hypothetical protein
VGKPDKPAGWETERETCHMSSVPDYLKVALWVSGLGGIVALICLGYVVWSNGNSRNLALGAGALLGSVILMAVQLLFELRSPPTETDTLSTEYTMTRRCRKFVNGATVTAVGVLVSRTARGKP